MFYSLMSVEDFLKRWPISKNKWPTIFLIHIQVKLVSDRSRVTDFDTHQKTATLNFGHRWSG